MDSTLPTQQPGEQAKLFEPDPPSAAERKRMAEQIGRQLAEPDPIRPHHFGDVADWEIEMIRARGGHKGHVLTLIGHRVAAHGRKWHRRSRDTLARLAMVSRPTIVACSSDLVKWGRLNERGKHPGRKRTGSSRTYEVLSKDQQPLFVADIIEAAGGQKARGEAARDLPPGGKKRAGRGQKARGVNLEEGGRPKEGGPPSPPQEADQVEPRCRQCGGPTDLDDDGRPWPYCRDCKFGRPIERSDDEIMDAVWGPALNT